MQDDLIENVEIPKDLFDIINNSIPKEPQVLEIVENDKISIKWQCGSKANDNWRLSSKKWLVKMERCNQSKIRFPC